VKRYEGLFILNTTGREEGVKDALDKISSEITAAGGKVETVQKMDRKSFARVADKKHNAGLSRNCGRNWRWTMRFFAFSLRIRPSPNPPHYPSIPNLEPLTSYGQFQ
jgi:hypothetical protein